MSYGSIIDGLLQQGMASQSQQRLKTGAENAERSGGIEDVLGSLLGGRSGRTGGTGGSGGGFADMARDFLRKPQAGGMSGGKIGGLGALAGAVFGRGGIGGAARGGAMAILGTLALNAWRDYQAQSSGGAGAAAPGEAGQGRQSAQPTPEQVEALTDPRTERLMLKAMIGAAQVDGRITGPELDKILGRMGDGEVTEEERRTVQQEVARPVDVEEIGRAVSRPEVAMQIYLAALMAVDIDTDAERDYFRRLASALNLQPAAAQRLHRMTGAPPV